MDIYEAAEDSFLLLDAVRKHANGKVLDMGSGSGILANEALKMRRVKSVTAVDINIKAKEKLDEKIKFIQSDLFEKLNGEFDTIIFNPPYLPKEEEDDDVALYGGKKGYEVIERFLQNAEKHLSDHGQILLLFSTLTNKEKVEEFLENNMLAFEKISEMPIFMEKLYVYKIQKSKLLLELKEKGITQIKKFAQGSRGIVYVGNYKKKKVAIKVDKGDFERIKAEAKTIRQLNKQNIGPEILGGGINYFFYKFVEGKYIVDFFHSASTTEIKIAIMEIMRQCRELDKMKITKEEMTRPLKHIIIGEKIVFIDFERARFSARAKNVSQLCMFLMKKNICGLLGKKGIQIKRAELIDTAKKYKNNPTQASFNAIIRCIKS